MSEQTDNEKRGENIGASLNEMARQEAAAAATPEGKQADRKAHRGVIIAAVAFAVLLIGAGVAYSVLSSQSENEKIEVTGTDAVHETEVDPAGDTGDGNGANATTPAPDFAMTDTEGKTLKLSDFQGRPVLLNFWASWCGPCASEMPAIQTAWEQHGENVAFVIVNMTDMGGETEQTARAFLADAGYTFPVYFDQNSSAATAFGVTSIPQTYLINSSGEIVGAYMGAMSENVIDEGVAMLTDGQAAS
ncbi:TlpA disulfide reductase family protein [Eggerthellaceae bacterium 24-137]